MSANGPTAVPYDCGVKNNSNPASPKASMGETVLKNRIDANNTMWLSIKNLNQYITCGICRGYLYEASTITECMHSFCKSCIVKHVERSLQCPTCHILIHPTDPFVHIRLDRLLQDIVYGLLPHLAEEEFAREKKYYAESASKPVLRHQPLPLLRNNNFIRQSHTSQSLGIIPLVSLSLECRCSSVLDKRLDKKFIRVSGNATVSNVITFLCKKLIIDNDFGVSRCYFSTLSLAVQQWGNHLVNIMEAISQSGQRNLLQDEIERLESLKKRRQRLKEDTQLFNKDADSLSVQIDA